MAGKPRTRRIVLDDGEVLAGSAPTPRLVERFLTYIEHERGLAVNTRAAYRRDLTDFTAWLGERAAVGLGIADLGDYLATLDRKGLARASIARQAATLRTFYAFLQLEGLIAESPATLIAAGRRDDTIPGTLSPGQVDRLLGSPDPRSINGIRDRALLELLYATGCRASEVSHLRVTDVQLVELFCTCRGKGDKERMVPLGRRAVGAPVVTGQPSLEDAHLGDRARACRAGGCPVGHRAAHAAAQLRDPHGRRRSGPATRAGDAGAREHRDHPALHPRGSREAPVDPRAIPSASLTARAISPRVAWEART